jgi:hypothetical protein
MVITLHNIVSKVRRPGQSGRESPMVVHYWTNRKRICGSAFAASCSILPTVRFFKPVGRTPWCSTHSGVQT